MKQSKHFPGMLFERTGLTWEELTSEKEYETILPESNHSYRIVKKKQIKYPHQHFLVFKDDNLFVGYDPITDLLCTVMYLDGKWGYPNKEYNADEHYGRQ